MSVLASIAAWMLKTFGIAGCALAVTLFYFEGIPGADKLKFPTSYWIVGGFGVADIPVIGPMTVGHVASYAADQVKVATAAAQTQCDIRVAKLISGYEASVLKSQLAAQAESQRQAAIVTSEYSNRLAAANAEADQKDKDLDDALERNEKLRIAAGLKCSPLDDGTADLLRKHGFEVRQ